MAQFTVYANNNTATRTTYPYLIDVQSDLLSALSTTLVIPLIPTALAKSFQLTKLNPDVTVEGKTFALMTQDMASVSKTQLTNTVGDLSHDRDRITAAIDLLFFGI